MNIGEMMSKFKEMQEKMQETQDNLVHIKASAEAGAGMVKANVNGKKQLLSISIDPDLLNPNDQEMMQDLVVAAVNKALSAVDIMVKEQLQKTAKDVMPNMPDIDLDKFQMP